MHPMFAKLYLEADPDDLTADEEGKRRTAARSRRVRSRAAARIAARDRDRRPQR